MKKEAKSIELMREWLENLGVDVVGTTNEFYGGDPEEEGQGLWIAADSDEEGDYFRYYGSSSNKNYTAGVHVGLTTQANSDGWWFEWNDAGTIMMWPF